MPPRVPRTVVAINDHLSRIDMTTSIRGVRSVSSGIVPGLSIDRNVGKPLYRQLCDGFREAIVERRLRGGQRLPSTRALAAELRISRIPVLNAFEQLLAEGYFESRRGSGTYVAGTLPDDDRGTNRPAARQAVKQPGPRPVARRPAAVLRPGPEPWLGGWGAFRLSEPAVDHFPRAVWSRLVARHTRGAKRGDLTYGSA